MFHVSISEQEDNISLWYHNLLFLSKKFLFVFIFQCDTSGEFQLSAWEKGESLKDAFITIKCLFTSMPPVTFNAICFVLVIQLFLMLLYPTLVLSGYSGSQQYPQRQTFSSMEEEKWGHWLFPNLLFTIILHKIHLKKIQCSLWLKKPTVLLGCSISGVCICVCMCGGQISKPGITPQPHLYYFYENGSLISLQLIN